MTETDFGGLRIRYDARVLEPRAWTAAQSEWAAELIRGAPPGPVLELCTGAGHIGLLAVHLAPRQLVAVDIDPVACDLARHNAAVAGLPVEVRCGPMSEVVREDEQFAVVIADPPWVPSDGVAEFPEDPELAIDGGADGLSLARQCVEVIARHLADGGAAVLQVGPEQADEIATIVAAYPQLTLGEVRQHPRGALIRLDRSGA